MDYIIFVFGINNSISFLKIGKSYPKTKNPDKFYFVRVFNCVLCPPLPWRGAGGEDYNPKATFTSSTKSNFSQVNNSTVTVFSIPPGAEKVLVTVSGVLPMWP